MKLKINGLILFTFLIGLMFTNQKSFSQCIQIESILVAACSPATPPSEGYNEMVRFKVGAAAINTSNMSVDWPANNWQGLIKNATTAAKVATLNAAIDAAGGCGNLIEPTGGVLPANATVVLVTSYQMNTSSNTFGALAEDTYIIFQNNTNVTGGHFANYNSTPGLRTLEISFGASCIDIVTYERSNLVNQVGTSPTSDDNGKGATVLFTPAGVATYVNYGCSAPVQPFTVDAGPVTMNACAGTTINLTGTALGHQSVTWTALSGTFSNATNLSSSYTIPSDAAGQVINLVLTATNTCGATITDTIALTVNNSVTPVFNLPTTICSLTTNIPLPTTSINGITGTWNPSVIINSANGVYVFTPNTGQCATPFTLNVTVTSLITPIFSISNALCPGATAPLLPTTSNNGIVGTWNPSVVSNTVSGNYVFTPNAGQCAVPFTLTVTVGATITPTFSIPTIFCSGTTAPILPATSNNGIVGTWNPSIIDATADGTYVFTPNPGQCAVDFTLNVTVGATITPTFSIPTIFCSGTTAPILPATSNNGITGTWNPSIVDNTTNGTYVFTPNPGQCAVAFTLTITVSSTMTPVFSIANLICAGSIAPSLPTTSTNGIVGIWNPSIVDNTASGTYIFTPNNGQCADNLSIDIVVTSFDIDSIQECKNDEFVVTALPLNNSFDPNNATYTWKNSAGVVVGMNQNELNITQLMNTAPIIFPATFEVTVSDNSGCSATLNVVVYGAFCKIPKGISPNNDGDNDNFNLTGMGIKEIFIYNRYGTEIYNKKNYTDEWEGQSKDGHDLPTGTYYYVIYKNTNETYTGWVYIQR